MCCEKNGVLSFKSEANRVFIILEVYRAAIAVRLRVRRSLPQRGNREARWLAYLEHQESQIHHLTFQSDVHVGAAELLSSVGVLSKHRERVIRLTVREIPV